MAQPPPQQPQQPQVQVVIPVPNTTNPVEAAAHNSRKARLQAAHASLDASYDHLKATAATRANGRLDKVIFTEGAKAKRATLGGLQYLELQYQMNPLVPRCYRYYVVAHEDEQVAAIGKAWLSLLWDADVDPLQRLPLLQHNGEPLPWLKTLRELGIRTDQIIRH